MEPQHREERGTQTILIVESDESIRRILDLTLRQAGFSVGLASNKEEALKHLADHPDLMIVAASDPDGLALCRLAKQSENGLAPAVVLISDPGLESKTRGLEAGADDFVVKPIYVQEVVARARALLQRRERERLELSAFAPVSAAPAEGADAAAPQVTDRFVSDIGDVPLVDLLRAISAHQKSGVALITAAGGARGEIFFRQGNVVDAEVGRLSGRDAIYRLFCWSSGRLEIEWKSIRRKDTIEMRPHDLLMEALQRVDEWRRLLTGLPPLDTIFEVDYRVLAERLADIPDEVNGILRLFDGTRTFLQVIDDCGLSDLDAAAAIGKLCHERIVHDVRVPVADDGLLGADMEGWLSDATGPFRSPPRLERDVFGAAADMGVGAQGRPTSPFDPSGEAPRDALDDEMRARFTDRLEAEGHPLEMPAVIQTAPSSGPTTLPGFGTAAPEPLWTALEVPAAAPGEMATSIEAVSTTIGETMPTPDLAVIVERDIPHSLEAVPLARAEPAVLFDAAGPAESIEPAEPAEPPLLPAIAAALPIGTEVRSASGEIVVRPASAKIKQSPAAEARLAHLREEDARAFVRSSQTLTPPGSARALDEPPPMVSVPPPEPPRPAGPVAPSHVEDDLSSGEGSDEMVVSSHRRGMFLVAVVAVLVVGAGTLVLRSRRSSTREAFSDESTTQAPEAPPPRAASPATVSGSGPPSPTTVASGAVDGGATAETSGRPAAAGSPTPDDLDEWGADPKMARVREAEADQLLAACHLSFQEERMKDAEAACTAARDANLDSAEAHGLLAHALFNRNHRRESLVEAERAVKLNPRWADAYVIIGGVHQDAGEIDDAKRAYQRYLELDPGGQYAGDLRGIVDRLGKL